MPTLTAINTKPIAEVWKDVEAQQPAFDQWTKEVQTLIAEEQVKAVVKTLTECKTLTTVNLRATKVTADDIAALKKALPNCKVDWDGQVDHK